MLRSWRLGAAGMAVALGLLVAVLVGGTGASAQTQAHPAKLSVGVQVARFHAQGRKLSASGFVTAKLTDNHGHVTTVHSKVVLSAKTGGQCRVLHLDLKELTLSLLGLHAHLDRVVLDVTGQPHGGVLGALFCKLARAKVASARAAAARALTAQVRRQQGHVLRFTANLAPATTTSNAANATCPVLDLVVGPLNLQLLGLVVDLNRVHLVVTATRGGGTLGDVFCKLADNTTTTTTTTTTS